MTLREKLLAVIDAYQAGHGLTATTVSKRLFDNTRKLSDMRRSDCPADMTTAGWERAMLQMSRTWPEGTAWPSSVSRPASQ